MAELSEHAAVEAQQITNAHATENALTVVEEEVSVVKMDQAMQTMLEIGKMAGRVQSATIVGNVADAITVSQLQQMKAAHKEAGLTWEQACGLIGISRRTADLYLKQAADLGDDFFGNCRRLGVSVRTMETARQLPEPVRQALAQGEVVDLETVSKEALTQAIRDLATEHARETDTLQRDLEAERKLSKKALDKGAKAVEERDALAQEVEALKEGLPPEDREALELIRAKEREIIPWLVTVKNTTHLEGRDPHFVRRLVNHLNLISELAQATGHVLACLAEGDAPNEDLISHAARQANQACATYDQADPYAGI